MALKQKRSKRTKTRIRRVGAASVPTNKGYDAYRYIFRSEVEDKECLSIIKSYIRSTYSKTKAQAILRNEDWRINRNHVAAYCYWVGQKSLDDVFSEETKSWMAGFFEGLYDRGKTLKDEEDQKKKSKKKDRPSIQDRMQEQLNDLLGGLEVSLDSVNTAKQPDFFEFLKKEEVPQVQIKKIRDFYTPQYEELVMLKSKKCPEELAEGYSNLSKSELNKILKWFDALFADLDSYENVKKATRKKRVAKPKSADKLVQKMQYKKEDKDFKIASINPINIIGASVVFTFNTRYKALGVYISDGALSVKGTTLQNFNTVDSYIIRLRKPNEILPQVVKLKSINKIQKLLNTLTTKKSVVKGRINKDTVLLKVM